MSKVTCMPPTAYNRTISTIRDYPRMVMELEQMRNDVEGISAASIDGMPKSSGNAGLEDKVARLVDLEREVQEMKRCINSMPSDMRDGIMNNILYNMPFPRNEYAQMVPSLRTWQIEKQKFVKCFARAMKIYRT